MEESEDRFLKKLVDYLNKRYEKQLAKQGKKYSLEKFPDIKPAATSIKWHIVADRLFPDVCGYYDGKISVSSMTVYKVGKEVEYCRIEPSEQKKIMKKLMGKLPDEDEWKKEWLKNMKVWLEIIGYGHILEEVDEKADKETISREIVKRLPDVSTFLEEADERAGKGLYVGKELVYREIIKRLENKVLLLKEIDEKTGRDIIHREIRRRLPNRDEWRKLKPICGGIIDNLARGDEVAKIVSKKTGFKVTYIIPDSSQVQDTYFYICFDSKGMNDKEKTKTIERAIDAVEEAYGLWRKW